MACIVRKNTDYPKESAGVKMGEMSEAMTYNQVAADYIQSLKARVKELEELNAFIVKGSFDASAAMAKENAALRAKCSELRDALKGCNEMFDTYGHTSESPCQRDREIVAKMLKALEPEVRPK